MPAELSPTQTFRQGGVVQLERDWGYYYIKPKGGAGTATFDIVMTNRHGAFCDRRTVPNSKAQSLIKGTPKRRRTWGVSRKEATDLWPNCADW